MSHQKGGKGAAAKAKKPRTGGAGDDDKGEDILQAVVLADSFQDRFAPFTLEKPRCLLPLANTPLIEYTLEFLAMNGVQEVFIYCGNHTDQVEQYVFDSPRWTPTSPLSPFSLLDFVRVNDASSPGDFLRDLDKRGLISGDFLLVHGDLVANIPLDEALTAHRRRRDANRDAIMTMVLREGGAAQHHAKGRAVSPVFTVDAASGRCLQYDEPNTLRGDHHVVLDPAALDHDDVEIRADLIDCEIDICTPDVLALWSDSFDYELPRRHFLHGVLKDWELNGKIIYTDIVDRGYAARASNLQMYEAMSRDVMGRWTFPMVPDNNLVSGQTYTFRSGSVYAEKGVMLESESHVERSVLGMKTRVGTGSRISNSVIGRRCHIGSNVVIEDSFIWSDATIEDGARITRSVVAGNAVIGKDCTIPAGSLLSYNVQISEGVSLPASTTISLLTRDRVLVESNTSLVGLGGKGTLYQYEDDDEYDELDRANLERTLVYSTAHLNLSTSSISSFGSTMDSELDSDDDTHARLPGNLAPGTSNQSRDRHMSFISNASGDSGMGATSFHNDAVTSLVDALRSDEVRDMDAAKLEFMGLRLATNASDAAMTRAIATALVRAAVDLMAAAALEPSKAAERALTAKKGTAKFVTEVGVGGEGTADQAAFALALQKAAASAKGVETGRAGTLLAALLQHLYNLDVLEEDGILAWWKASEGKDQAEKMGTVREKCRVLIDWLQEDDGDSDDSDE